MKKKMRGGFNQSRLQSEWAVSNIENSKCSASPYYHLCLATTICRVSLSSYLSGVQKMVGLSRPLCNRWFRLKCTYLQIACKQDWWTKNDDPNAPYLEDTAIAIYSGISISEDNQDHDLPFLVVSSNAKYKEASDINDTFDILWEGGETRSEIDIQYYPSIHGQMIMTKVKNPSLAD